MENRRAHQILGVSQNAPINEVRQAYKLRSKMFDPGRFDRETQPEEWAAASRMMEELNRAYREILGEPEDEVKDDQTEKSSSSTGSGKKQPSRPTSDSDQSDDNSKASRYSRINRSQVDRYLTLRIRRRYSEGRQIFHCRTGPHWAVYLASFSVLFLWMTPFGYFAVSLDPFRFSWTTFVTICVVGLQSFFLMRAWQLLEFLVPFKQGTLLCPLYIIAVSNDQVEFFPIWEIESIERKGTEPKSHASDIDLIIRSGTWHFSIRFSSETQIKYFLERMNYFASIREYHLRKKNWEYFADHDELLAAEDPSNFPRVEQISSRLPILFFVLLVLLAVFWYRFYIRASEPWLHGQNPSKTVAPVDRKFPSSNNAQTLKDSSRRKRP